MSSVATNVNIAGFNRPQLRALARNVGVAGVTEHSALTTFAQFITAIRAK